jgi:hypothetical protein
LSRTNIPLCFQFTVECTDKYTRDNVHLLYEPGYVTPCVGNLTGKKYYESMFEFTDKYMRDNVHLLYEPGYVTPCVGNLTGKKYYENTFEFPTDI